MIKVALFDIEGTTTKISFVHDVLFPYASANLNQFVRKNCKIEQIALALDDTRLIVESEGDKADSLELQIDTLLKWIKEDRKVAPLKAIQGYIWKDGYETGQFRSHVYDDVAPVLKKMNEQGIILGIYSSGSVKAQKLLFGHTQEGDLNPLLSYYFDTGVGYKREKSAYESIFKELSETHSLVPEQILFVSDVKEELDAAREAGFTTQHILRPGTPPQTSHPVIKTFHELLS